MTDTDRIAELESRLFSRRMAIGAHQREVDYIESELARLKEPEWEEVEYGHGAGWTKFDQQGAYLAIPMPQSLVTWIENRAVDRYKRDQADAVGALRAIDEARDNPTTALSFLDALQRGRATLRAIDEGKRS